MHKLKDKKIIPVYLAQNYIEYKEATIKKAIITGSLWGCNRGSLRVSKALKKLAEDCLLEGYGLKHSLGFLMEGYKGYFEEFGAPIDSIVKIQNDYGIALIIHNLEHMLDGIPTSRISEAAAAGVLIITDQHPFIKKYFGENALYFDAFGNDDEIYSQVKSHIVWAQNNKSKAIVKAKNTYNIFVQNFTMEKQLEFLMQEVTKSP
jgi:phosphoglycerol transferase